MSRAGCRGGDQKLLESVPLSVSVSIGLGISFAWVHDDLRAVAKRAGLVAASGTLTRLAFGIWLYAQAAQHVLETDARPTLEPIGLS